MRYFSFCKMSAASKLWSRQYRVNHPLAPEGFIFHDDEQPLDIEHLRYPLFKLSQLFENSKEAIVFRVNKNTLAASYSLVALPPPVLLRRNERQYDSPLKLYPVTGDMPGWYIADVKEKSSKISAFDIGNMYDNCTQLQRVMGTCPCPHKDSGLCLTENVLPGLGEGIKLENLESNYYASFSDRIKADLKRNFAEVHGFVFVSPSYTTANDFYDGLRPWDDVDFSQVEERKKEFTRRGAARKTKNKFVKSNCSECIFAHKITDTNTKKLTVVPCEAVRRCHGAVSREETVDVLKRDYLTKGIEARSKFSFDQICDLIPLTGTQFYAKTNISIHRRLDVELTGFKLIAGEYVYTVRPVHGNKCRETSFETYDQLLATIPEVAGRVAEQRFQDKLNNKPPLPKEILWGISLLPRVPQGRGGWGSVNELHSVSVVSNFDSSEFEINARFTNGRYTWINKTLTLSNLPYAWLSPYVVSHNGLVKTLARTATTKGTAGSTQSSD